MKRISVAILMILFVFCGLNLDAQKRKVDKIKYPQLRKFNLPTVEKAQTANGIKLRLIHEGKLPIVSLYALFKGGDAFEQVKNNLGVSSTCARLIQIGGTKNYKPAALDKLLDAQGITIVISSSDDYFRVYLTCLKEKFAEAVKILAEMLQQPAFDKDKLTEIMTQTRSAISRRNDQPRPINNREFAKLIYGPNSTHGAVLEYEDLDRITLAKIKETYKNYFGPGNMLAGVIGPLSLQEVKSAFEKHLGAWRNQVSVPEPPVVKEVKHPFQVAFIQKGNIDQSYLSIGHLGIKGNLSPGEKAKIQVFNNIFGGGFSSRLVSRVRVKMGLTYGIGGGITMPYWHKGLVRVSTFTKSKSTLTAIEAILDEIKKIREEKVTAKELNDAQDYFKNSFVFNYSTPAQILFRSLINEFYGIKPGFDEELLAAIGKVTVEDVHQVAQQYLHPDKLMIQVVGDKAKIKDDLGKLGKVQNIDITIPAPKMKEKIPTATKETLARGLKLIQDCIKKNYRPYKKLKGFEMLYKMKMITPRGEMAMDVKTITQYPDKSFSELTVMGMKLTQVINGLKGVMNQMGQKRKLTVDQIKEGKFTRTYDMVTNTDRYSFQYLKETMVDGQPCHVLYMTGQDYPGKWAKLYVNKTTLLVDVVETMGSQGLMKTVNSEYKKVGGIPFAHRTIVYVNGKKSRDVTVQSIKVNPKVDPKIFKVE